MKWVINYGFSTQEVVDALTNIFCIPEPEQITYVQPSYTDTRYFTVTDDRGMQFVLPSEVKREMS